MVWRGLGEHSRFEAFVFGVHRQFLDSEQIDKEQTLFSLIQLYTPGAVLIGMVYEFLPFMILPLYSSLEKFDPSLLEAAADLGARPWRTFLRVTLPLSLPGIVAGSILVFVPAMGMFVVPDLMGGARTVLVGNLIRNQLLVARDWPFGSAASMVLTGLTLLVTIVFTPASLALARS